MQDGSLSQTFSLHGEDIDRFSEWLDEAQRALGVERQNRIRARLLMEEVLLRLRDRLGEEHRVFAICERRLWYRRLRVEVTGKPCNPLNAMSSELGDWESSLFTAIGLSPQYTYERDRNVLRVPLPHPSMNPVLRIGIAILAGVLCGVLGGAVLPAGLRQEIADVLLVPTYELWNRVLTAISGPIIFLTVATTLLNTRRIEERGGSSAWVIMRYFVISILTVTAALVLVLPLVRLTHVGFTLNKDLMLGLLQSLARVVPSNVFEPFLQADTSQLLFLAFVLGSVLRMLGERVDLLTRFVRQANIVGLQVAGWVSWLVPPVAGAFLCLELWQDHADVLLGLWQPFFMALVISAIVMLCVGALLSQVMQVSPLTLLRKLRSPFVAALRTGSLDDSFAEAQRSCTDLLGIDQEYVRVGLPQGLVLYMPISAIGTIVFTLFAARMMGVQGSSVWYVTAIVMAVVVFVATPPVPGANLLAYVALFSALGVPEGALLDAMIFDIVFGIFAGAANQAMLQMEMVLQTSRLGLLDKQVLRRSA